MPDVRAPGQPRSITLVIADLNNANRANETTLRSAGGRTLAAEGIFEKAPRRGPFTFERSEQRHGLRGATEAV